MKYDVGDRIIYVDAYGVYCASTVMEIDNEHYVVLNRHGIKMLIHFKNVMGSESSKAPVEEKSITDSITGIDPFKFVKDLEGHYAIVSGGKDLSSEQRCLVWSVILAMKSNLGDKDVV